mmetsp:Transcript_21386/g.67742  ORF Transcript_21386/g.67742 Transcript_21386/m.67742 type:complete len:226 (+) Transcript_21386:197-874(+)
MASCGASALASGRPLCWWACCRWPSCSSIRNFAFSAARAVFSARMRKDSASKAPRSAACCSACRCKTSECNTARLRADSCAAASARYFSTSAVSALFRFSIAACSARSRPCCSRKDSSDVCMACASRSAASRADDWQCSWWLACCASCASLPRSLSSVTCVSRSCEVSAVSAAHSLRNSRTCAAVASNSWASALNRSCRCCSDSRACSAWSVCRVSSVWSRSRAA